MSDHIKKMSQTVNRFNSLVEKKMTIEKQKLTDIKQKITEFQEELEEKTNLISYRLDDLKKKEKVLVALKKVSPTLPTEFPKNFEFVLNYGDIVLTGNQKFLDFEDQADLNEKFIVPPLESGSQKIKIQVWGTDQIRTLYDYTQIDLEAEVDSALQARKAENQVKFIKNPDYYLEYSIELQGIGFESWLKNLQVLRDAQQQLQFGKKQNQATIQIRKQKAQDRINTLNKKFQGRKKQESLKQQSYEQSRKQIDTLLDYLRQN